MADLKELTIWLDLRNGEMWVKQNTDDPMNVRVVEYEGGTHELTRGLTTALPEEQTRVRPRTKKVFDG